MPASQKTSTPPVWAKDRATWQRAYDAVRPRYDEYDAPYAVVTKVYENMGGRIERGHTREHPAYQRNPVMAPKRKATAAQMASVAKMNEARAKKAAKRGDTALARELRGRAAGQRQEVRLLTAGSKTKPRRGPTRGPGPLVHRRRSGVYAALPPHQAAPPPPPSPPRGASMPKTKKRSQTRAITLVRNTRTGVYEARAPRRGRRRAAPVAPPPRPRRRPSSAISVRARRGETDRQALMIIARHLGPKTRKRRRLASGRYSARFKPMGHRTTSHYLDRSTGRRVTVRRYRANPASTWGELFLCGGGMLLGAIIGEVTDRAWATRTPANGKHPWYGTDAAERIATRPDGSRVMVQVGQGIVWIALSMLTSTRFPRLSNFWAGAFFGVFVRLGVQLWTTRIAPMLFKVNAANEQTMANRLYAWEQDSNQTNLENAHTQIDNNAATYPGQQDPIPMPAAGASGASMRLAQWAGPQGGQRSGPGGQPRILNANAQERQRQEAKRAQTFFSETPAPAAKTGASDFDVDEGCNSGGCGPGCGCAACKQKYGINVPPGNPSDFSKGYSICNCGACVQKMLGGLPPEHKPRKTEPGDVQPNAPALSDSPAPPSGKPEPRQLPEAWRYEQASMGNLNTPVSVTPWS